MTQRNANKYLFGMALSASAVTAVFLLSARLSAQPPGILDPAGAAQEEPKAEREVAVEIGTYKPEEVFQSHPLQEKLAEASQRARAELQQAQEAEDEQQMQQIQQDYQEAQSQLVEAFHRDVDESLPEAAAAAGVQVIATEIVYTAENVGTKDITPDLIKVITESAEGEGRPPAVPQFQPQGG